MLLKLLISLDLAFADQIFSISWIFTGRNEVLAKVIFSQACVKNSVHSGGVPDQAPPRTRQVPPGTRHPPRPGRYPPGPGRYPPQTMQVPPRTRQVPPQTRQVPPLGPDTLPQTRQVPPRDQTPPQTRQVPPRTRQVPPQTMQVPPRTRQVPPQTRQVPPLGPDTLPRTREVSPRDQTPPPGTADSGIRSTFGRYASYWNAFLFSGNLAKLYLSVPFPRRIGTPYRESSFLDPFLFKSELGGHSTEKTRNMVFTFSRQENHREFCFNRANSLETHDILT